MLRSSVQDQCHFVRAQGALVCFVLEAGARLIWLAELPGCLSLAAASTAHEVTDRLELAVGVRAIQLAQRLGLRCEQRGNLRVDARGVGGHKYPAAIFRVPSSAWVIGPPRNRTSSAFSSIADRPRRAATAVWYITVAVLTSRPARLSRSMSSARRALARLAAGFS